MLNRWNILAAVAAILVFLATITTPEGIDLTRAAILAALLPSLMLVVSVVWLIRWQWDKRHRSAADWVWSLLPRGAWVRQGFVNNSIRRWVDKGGRNILTEIVVSKDLRVVVFRRECEADFCFIRVYQSGRGQIMAIYLQPSNPGYNFLLGNENLGWGHGPNLDLWLALVLLDIPLTARKADNFVPSQVVKAINEWRG